MMISFFDRIANIVGDKGDAVYTHFLFPPYFQEPSLSGLFKLEIMR